MKYIYVVKTNNQNSSAWGKPEHAYREAVRVWRFENETDHEENPNISQNEAIEDLGLNCFTTIEGSEGYAPIAVMIEAVPLNIAPEL